MRKTLVLENDLNIYALYHFVILKATALKHCQSLYQETYFFQCSQHGICYDSEMGWTFTVVIFTVCAKTGFILLLCNALTVKLYSYLWVKPLGLKVHEFE